VLTLDALDQQRFGFLDPDPQKICGSKGSKISVKTKEKLTFCSENPNLNRIILAFSKYVKVSPRSASK